jgi:poly(A) polymerase
MRGSKVEPVRQSVQFPKKFLDKNALRVVNTIHKAGFEVYLVGGCVRDLLLGNFLNMFEINTRLRLPF